MIPTLVCITMEQTASFKNLAPDQRAKLRDLCVDYFFRRQDDFWMREAMQKLPALKRVTDMLICGEDLGMVPACVPEVMRDLGFLSLEIQRMPKAMGVEFSRPADAPYLSVVTPSTHDMSTIRGWWTEDRELTQKFFNRELGLAGEAPRAASPEIVEAVVRQHLASPAMWSIFQLQDLLGTDGQLRRAIGTAGMVKAGPYDPTLMHNPKGVTLDDRGRLWVAENDLHAFGSPDAGHENYTGLHAGGNRRHHGHIVSRLVTGIARIETHVS